MKKKSKNLIASAINYDALREAMKNEKSRKQILNILKKVR